MIMKKGQLPEVTSSLKDLRKDSGYTQDALAMRLGISREKVSYIENSKISTLGALEIEIVKKWWFLCRATAKEKSRQSFIQAVFDYFKF